MDLYGQLAGTETLQDAWAKIRRKNAAGGIDGVNPKDLDEKVGRLVAGISEDLSKEIYAPAPYQQIHVPKFNEEGEWRCLSLPVVRDKIVQQAAVTLMSPVFEKIFVDTSYAYREKKGPVRAIRRIEHILQNHRPRWVVLCDIDNFFDTVDHDRLLDEVKTHLDDPRLLSLIRSWMRAGYISRKGKFSDPEEGIAQGSIISPLLSNVYLHMLDVHALEKGYHYVRYSDNFILLAHDKDQAYLVHEDVNGFMEEKLLLKLNVEKEPLRDIRAGFTFLGIYFKGSERRMSREKEAKILKKLSWLTDPRSGKEPNILIEKLNDKIRSQKRFYGFINPQRQFAAFDEHIQKRLNDLLVAYGKKGILPAKEQKEEFLLRVALYGERSEAERRATAKRIAQAADEEIRSAKDHQAERADEPAQDAASAAKRCHAQKNRFLKMVSNEAEVVVSSPGVFIGKTSMRLVLREDRRKVEEQPFSKVRQITITTSGVSLSSDVVWACAENKIPLAFLNRKGMPYAILQSPLHSTGEISLGQIRICGTDKALAIGKKMLTGKCRNQMNVLKFYSRHRARSDPGFFSRVKEALERMEKDLSEIRNQSMGDDFEKVRNRLFTAEARVSSHYWGIVKMLLPAELGFDKREKHGARDIVNCMLNYGYSILYQRVWKAVLMAGLNPHISFVHSFQENKPTFVYDTIEEFRQALVDRPLFSLMTRGSRYRRLKVDSTTGLLDDFTRLLTLRAVLQRFSMLVPFRGRKVQAEDIIQSQVRDLAAFICGKKKHYRPFISTY